MNGKWINEVKWKDKKQEIIGIGNLMIYIKCNKEKERKT
jgi:hypothetical protein